MTTRIVYSIDDGVDFDYRTGLLLIEMLNNITKLHKGKKIEFKSISTIEWKGKTQSEKFI